MRQLRLGPVYPITSVPNRHWLSHSGLARTFAQAGVPLLQIREKRADARDQFLEVRAVLDDPACGNVQIVVNDRLDIAMAAGAAGVHLGWEDLPVAEARRIAGKDLLIGLSTHNPEQFLRAQEMDVDYVAIGPVFGTRSKQSRYPAVGVETVLALSASSRLPVVAIGGIDLEAAELLWAGGIDSVAVIADLVEAEEPPEIRIAAYLEAWRSRCR